MNLLVGGPAQANEAMVDAALKALWDGKVRTIKIMGNAVPITGRIWEIYRSIETVSIRIRYNDASGKVYHANSNDIEWIGGPVEVLPGTYSPNSGPHPPIVHADEVELMRPDIWEEAKRAVESPGSPS